jgi:16S rRNA processing protein RimM
METIPKFDCEKTGYFKKTHGVQGQLVLEYEIQYGETLENCTRLLVEIDGLLVPFFIAENGFRFKGANSAIVALDDVNTEKYAKRLVGAAVYLLKSEVESETDFEINNLKGFVVIDITLGELGKIEFIDDYSGNIVLTIDYKGSELLVPFNEDFLVEFNAEEKTLKLDLPSGLVDTE